VEIKPYLKLESYLMSKFVKVYIRFSFSTCLLKDHVPQPPEKERRKMV